MAADLHAAAVLGLRRTSGVGARAVGVSVTRLAYLILKGVQRDSRAGERKRKRERGRKRKGRREKRKTR